MQSKGRTVRKRTQIADANRVMFLWIAGVSVIFGFALVGTIFLTQMLLYNELVLSDKNKTIATINLDNNNIKTLESNIRVLNTKQSLINLKANSSDEAVQVVLDALPSEVNSLALGASIQDKLLANIPGLTLDSLQVNPVVGVESLNTDSTVIDSSSSGLSDSQNEITFTFSVSGDEAALQQTLTNLENSIRTIDITSLKIVNNGSSRELNVNARSFYEPARVISLKDKTVKQ
jgi:hypothetical protein